MTDVISIPDDLKPADGRFGAGPSKIQTSHLDALAATGSSLMGTSHRQAPVRGLVGRVKEGLTTFFDLPEGYEVVFGNGGATAFWDVATYGLIRQKSQHLSFGEFSSKFASVTQNAPFLGDSTVIKAEPGSLSAPRAEAGVDVYAWPHNETSTGVMAPVKRVDGDPGALTVIDATSAANPEPSSDWTEVGNSASSKNARGLSGASRSGGRIDGSISKPPQYEPDRLQHKPGREGCGRQPPATFVTTFVSIRSVLLGYLMR